MNQSRCDHCGECAECDANGVRIAKARDFAGTKNLEFHVGDRVFNTWPEACGQAAGEAASHGGVVNIDVVVWDEEAARAWGGDDAVERYNEDPEASVFERIEIRANSLGRVA